MWHQRKLNFKANFSVQIDSTFAFVQSRSSSQSQSTRLIQTQQDVDEVIHIFSKTLDKVMVRDEKLQHLNEQVDKLHNASSNFHQTAQRVKRRQWWENTKIKIIIVGTISLIIIAIIGKLHDKAC